MNTIPAPAPAVVWPDETVERALSGWFGAAHFAQLPCDIQAMKRALTAADVVPRAEYDDARRTSQFHKDNHLAAEAKLAEVAHELSCCDDVVLDDDPVVTIANLRAERDRQREEKQALKARIEGAPRITASEDGIDTIDAKLLSVGYYYDGKAVRLLVEG